MEVGYAISSEEHSPRDLVANARAAEDAGFTFGLISDHYHPWIDAQGHSAFVWAVIGGIAQVTERFRLGTGVTCPTIRIHPAIVAQAAATCACLLPGRFFLGVGSGENLNEHVLGDKWPAPDERLEMLEESVEVMRQLWQGDYQTHRGKHYTVENARIYTLPEETIQEFEKAGGSGKPKYGQLTVCWAESEEEAKRTAHEIWPNAGLEGPLSQELALPAHLEAASEIVEPDDLAETMPLGPDPERYLEQIREFEQAGFD